MPIIDTDKPTSVSRYADVFEELLRNRGRGHDRVDGKKTCAFKIPFEAADEVLEAYCSFSPGKPVLVIVKDIAKVAPGRIDDTMLACDDAEKTCLHINFALNQDDTISVRAASIFYAIEEQDFSWILALETITLYNEMVSAIQTHIANIREAAGCQPG